MTFSLGMAPAGLLTPRVKSHLLLALVPLGLAIATAGMAALEEMYTDRRQELAELKAAIAAEAADLAVRREARERGVGLAAPDHDGPCGAMCLVVHPCADDEMVPDGDQLVPAVASTT